MHKYKFIVVNQLQEPFDVYLDKEELDPLGNECVVVGSNVYRIIGTVKGKDFTQATVQLIGDKLYVGMLSEW